jgi:hypothetical protein
LHGILWRASTTTNQVDQQYDESYDKQQMDHATCNVEGESEQPKYQYDYKYRPKHQTLLTFCLSLAQACGPLNRHA